MTRTENSLRNLRFALLGQALGLLASFLARRVFVSVLTQEYLGLDGLFANILQMLSLAELGVGAAINYSLYKPLAEDDKPAVAALMRLYKRAYTCIGCVVALLGAALLPLLPVLIKDMPDIPNIRLIYLMFVGNSALSYFFTYKRSLIIADQKRYIATLYRYGMYVLMNLAQIAVLLLTGDYMLFLTVMLCATLAENLLLSRRADTMYPYLRTMDPPELEAETKTTIKKHVGAMLRHKIGGVAVSGTDNILLSRIVGLSQVAIYSNYFLISNALNTIYGLIFQSVIASVGNLGTMGDEAKLENTFGHIQFFTAWLYAFTLTSLVCLYNPFIEMWLGKAYLFPTGTVVVIALNIYFTGMRKAVLAFRDALGLYWYDRHKPLVEFALNLAVSVVLGIRLGTNGIFYGTIIATLATGFWVEPHVLYKHGFKASVKPYFLQYVRYALLAFAAAALSLWLCAAIPFDGLAGLLLRMLICLLVPNAFYFLAFCRTEAFRYFLHLGMRMLHKGG